MSNIDLLDIITKLLERQLEIYEFLQKKGLAIEYKNWRKKNKCNIS